ncbi:MAG: glycosyl hydrolase [Oscillospiraceae bacterium]|nr:glycosyl hydrolase [Oscillospiraceae bacterium]
MKLQKIIAWLVTIALMLCALPIATIADGSTSSEASTTVSTDGTLRRVVSTESPMWIVHIDTWNYPDPDKIIDLIPEDVLPYVVFNISLSVSWDSTTHEWTLVEDGYETAKSWLRTCAERGVWTLIQPSSGGRSHFPDYPDSSLEGTIFEEFFVDYPNFLGFNYCEQFWGYTEAGLTGEERYKHFANLLELCNKYGGYLVVSWCGNKWVSAINPLAMIKQVPEFEQACLDYTENFILCQKYTSTSYIQDMESIVLGTYLAGYCGNFGVRYDETGWDGSVPFTQSTGLAVMLETYLKSGATVIDGPELIWQDDFYEDDATVDDDGYTERQWSSYTQFTNVVTDMFRKILEGAIRIPTREEVIANTKLVIIQDVETGSDDDKYSTYPTLFEGLYQKDDDGNLSDNHNFYKPTGRYPTIPTVYALADDVAEQFEVQILQSEISERWATIEDKVAEFNELFPEEYSGNIYAGRNGNTWVVYNPLDSSESAVGTIPFQYNTADSMELTLSTYTTGIINEYSDSLEIYLNNYNENSPLLKKNDVIVISGCSEEPTITYTDRGINMAESTVTTEYENGVFTVTVAHNGPIDITINVGGSNTDRSTDYNVATIVEPESPPEYTGTRQYEAEFYAYKGITEYVKSGYGTGISNYYGQGYLVFGTAKGASVKDTVSVTSSGTYTLSIRYLLEKSNISGLALYVNDKKVSNITMSKTGSTSDWAYYTIDISLDSGENTIMLKSTSKLSDTLYLDCMMLDKGSDASSQTATTTLTTTASGMSSRTAALIIGIVGAVALVAVITVVVATRKKSKS